MILATDVLNAVTGRRLRKRRVHEVLTASVLSRTALQQKRLLIDIRHGGTVFSSYSHFVETEGLVTVAFPTGDVVQWGARLPAKGVSKSAVVVTCLGDWARPYADQRYGPDASDAARDEIIKQAKQILSSI